MGKEDERVTCSNKIDKYKCKTCPSFQTNFLAALKIHITYGHGKEYSEENFWKCLKCRFVTHSNFLIGRHSLFGECATNDKDEKKKRFIRYRNDHSDLSLSVRDETPTPLHKKLEDTEVRRDRRSLKLKEKRNLNENISVSPVVSAPDTVTSLSDTVERNEEEVVGGIVEAIDGKITLQIMTQVLHKGDYIGKMYMRPNSESTGFIRIIPTMTCKDCNPQFDLKIDGVIFTRQSKAFTFTTEHCLKTGLLSGNEMAMRHSNRLHTILTYSGLEEVSETVHQPATRRKQHCCKYCKKLVTQIPRHFSTTHGKEPEVVAAFKLTGKENRKAAFTRLRLAGDAAYNSSKPSSQKIFIRKLLTQPTSRSITCPKCQGLLGQRDFVRHRRRCVGCLATGHPVTKAAIIQQLTSRERPSEDAKTKNSSRFLKHSQSAPINEAVVNQPRPTSPGTALPGRRTASPVPGTSAMTPKKRRQDVKTMKHSDREEVSETVHQPATRKKQHCCKYCKRLVTQLSRHFSIMHGKEPEVVAAFKLTEKKAATLRSLG